MNTSVPVRCRPTVLRSWHSERRHMTRGPGLVGAVCAAALLASVHAQPLHAQQAMPESQFRGPLLDRSTLTGDWGGARDRLAASGITIAPSLTQFYQGPVRGNASRTFDYGGKADVFVDIDGGRLGLWEGFGIHIHGEYNFGRTPLGAGGTTIPNNTAMTFPYANQAGGDLTSVYLSQRFGSNVTIMAGKMNMFDFYASGHRFSGGRGIGGFWNTAFVGPPSGIVPVAAFGAVGIFKADPFSFSAMVYDPTDALNRTGFENPFSQGVNFRGTADLSSRLLGLPRTDSLMFAVSSEPGPDFSSGLNLSDIESPEARRAAIRTLTTQALFGQNARGTFTTQKRGRYWFGYSFEQTLWQNSTNPAQAWGLFGQAGISDGNPNSYRWQALVGIGGTSFLPNRSNDRFGVGFFYYGYSNELKNGLDPLVRIGDEYGGELFYNVAVTRWFGVTANAQVIAPGINSVMQSRINSDRAEVRNSTVVLLGLRAQISF